MEQKEQSKGVPEVNPQDLLVPIYRGMCPGYSQEILYLDYLALSGCLGFVSQLLARFSSAKNHQTSKLNDVDPDYFPGPGLR